MDIHESIPEPVERRLTELEIKATYSDDLLEQLNALVYRQQQQIDALMRELREASAASRSAGTQREPSTTSPLLPRARHVTSCPRSSALRATSRPSHAVPPSTSHRPMPPPEQAGRRLARGVHRGLTA